MSCELSLFQTFQVILDRQVLLALHNKLIAVEIGPNKSRKIDKEFVTQLFRVENKRSKPPTDTYQQDLRGARLWFIVHHSSLHFLRKDEFLAILCVFLVKCEHLLRLENQRAAVHHGFLEAVLPVLHGNLGVHDVLQR